MDTSKQLYEEDATGWQRGLYDDIKRTFRAPIVNWIFRTTAANYPEFLRYAWGQVKPVFETERFGRLSVRYRDAVLSPLEAADSIPSYRFEHLDLSPTAYAELRGQLATYDVVAPRLAVLFELVDRALSGDSVGADPDRSRSATAPLPPWLDADRGRPPTMVAFDEPPAELSAVVDAIQSFHGLEDGLPSIYRTIAQWPAYLLPMWDDLEPTLESDAFATAHADASEVVTEFVDEVAYAPRLDPDSLERAGIDEPAAGELRDLFREFNRGSIETVLPTLPIYAATVDADGIRSFS
jgi:hypothetical protein